MVFQLAPKEKYKCSGSNYEKRKLRKEDKEDRIWAKVQVRWEHMDYTKTYDSLGKLQCKAKREWRGKV